MTKNTESKNLRLEIGVLTLLSIIALSPLFLMNQGNRQGQQQSESESESVFKLSRASIPIDIPLAKGYENGSEIFFIATDASDEKIAEQATKMLWFKVNFAPLLSQTPGISTWSSLSIHQWSSR